MVNKVTAVGIFWIACSFFLCGGIQSDSLPELPAETASGKLPAAQEKKLLAEEEFIRLFSRLPDGLVRTQKDWASFFSLLDKTPASVTLNNILILSYQAIPDKKEKKRFAGELGKFSRRYPGNGILGAVASDILFSTGRRSEAAELIQFHLSYLEEVDEEKRNLLLSPDSPGREPLLYMARSLARFRLSAGTAEERCRELEKSLRLFPNDLMLLQMLLKSQYDAIAAADPKVPLFPFLDSPRQKAEKAFHKSCQLYLRECRKSLQMGNSLHIGRFHSMGLFYLGKSPWKEERKNLLLEECMPKFPALDPEEMITLAVLFEKDQESPLAAQTILRLLREENFSCDTLHFRLAEEKLRAFPSAGKLRKKLLELAVLSDPENPDPIIQLATLLRGEGKVEEARKLLQGLHPDPRAFAASAEMAFADGQLQQADDFLRKAMAGFNYPVTSSRHSDLTLFRALILDRLGRKQEVERLLRSLLRVQKDNHEAMNFLGYMLADDNRLLPEAETWIRQALAKKENQAYLDSYAWLCYRKKDYKNAILYIEKAIAASAGGVEPDSLIYDHAGDIYFACGEKKKALKFWEKAASCYSQEYDLANILAKIRKIKRELKK